MTEVQKSNRMGKGLALKEIVLVGIGGVGPVFMPSTFHHDASNKHDEPTLKSNLLLAKADVLLRRDAPHDTTLISNIDVRT